jgi:mono/diheme cytochrome c family protein
MSLSLRIWSVLALALTLAVVLTVSAALAMPEYANEVGEPCGACHISAAGGGLRAPRGQAWVAQQKPATVPSLDESLRVLGVRITGDPADYLAASEPPSAPSPLATRYERKMRLVEILLAYGGN